MQDQEIHLLQELHTDGYTWKHNTEQIKRTVLFFAHLKKNESGLFKQVQRLRTLYQSAQSCHVSNCQDKNLREGLACVLVLLERHAHNMSASSNARALLKQKKRQRELCRTLMPLGCLTPTPHATQYTRMMRFFHTLQHNIASSFQTG